MSPQPQTYANHRRLDPWYHIAVLGIAIVNLVAMLVALIRHPGLGSAWIFVMSAVLALLVVKVRANDLHNQDRLIRLEERLRLERLLPEDLKARIPELRVNQLVGLRFASDAEVVDRVRETFAKNLDLEAIKKRIQTWRPDTFRV
ncbi:MAG TPA: DUF6526 family protein [Holophagaceae bacterium]|jgi:hypothetical protein|nr:DUF6526 family protein [Holophagaceae bacterium]